MVLGNCIEREDSYVSWICNSKTRYSSPLFLVKVIYYKLKVFQDQILNKHVVGNMAKEIPNIQFESNYSKVKGIEIISIESLIERKDSFSHFTSLRQIQTLWKRF